MAAKLAELEELKERRREWKKICCSPRRQERISTITFNRPERRNALSPVLLHEFSSLLGELKKEDEVRCVVLRGAGDKAFSSGYDISALPTEVSPEVMEALRKKNPLETALRSDPGFSLPGDRHDQRNGLRRGVRTGRGLRYPHRRRITPAWACPRPSWA